MSKFIELMDKTMGDKVFVNVDKINTLQPLRDSMALISMSEEEYLEVEESYEQVKHLIETGEPLDNGDIAENKTIDTKLATEWLKQFNPSQVEQIMLGLEERVDVSLYAKKEFDYLQMEQIRLGQQSGVDVTLYVNAGFNWMQMRQILLGLQNGIDASLYAKQELKDYEMCLVRKKLEEKKGEVE